MTQHLPPSQPVWPLVIDQLWWVGSKFSDTNFASTNQVWFRPFSSFGSFQPGFIKRLDRPKMKVSIPRRRFELICVQTNGGHAIYTTGVQNYVWIQPKENETGSWREPHISKRRLTVHKAAIQAVPKIATFCTCWAELKRLLILRSSTISHARSTLILRVKQWAKEIADIMYLTVSSV